MKLVGKIFNDNIITLDKLTKYVNLVKIIHITTLQKRILHNEVRDLLNKYNFSLQELCYRIKNNILFDKIFTCKECGNKISFSSKGFTGYREYCSKKCSTKAISKMENIIQKREQTMLKKYGSKNYMSTQEFQQNKENNMLKKYNVKNYSQTAEFKSFLKDHKEALLMKSQKTCLKKYGTKHYTQTEEYKQNYDKIKEKMKQTCLKKYGVDCYNKTKEYKDRFKNIDYVNKIQEKVYIGKKKNNSFNTSKPEEFIYNKLVTKYGENNVKRQYKSDKYPFNCDFYLINEDLYIEYNGMWTHYTEFFDKNNSKHIEQLNLWKSKNTDFYKRAIRTWTETDIAKKEIAEKNNLNYLVLWNLKDFNRWYQK